MTILAIETSCDETSAAVMRDDKLLSNIVASQEEHVVWGGVVPELASRAHIAKIVPVVQRALDKSKVTVEQLQGVAATYGPGLIGSLLVGTTFAKGIALSLNIPFLGVNHLEGHLFSASLEYPELSPPFLCLVVSGGHTLLVVVKDVGQYDILGQTVDDAAGEAFDKIAKILGLPYPGGPAIEKLALEGNADAIKFPIAKIKSRPFDFSFSGLKTSVLYHFRALPPQQQEQMRADIAAAFQKAVVRALVEKLALAMKKYKHLKRVAISGGVARNNSLWQSVQHLAEQNGFLAYRPAPEFCTDNAAMIARTAALYFGRGKSSPLSLAAKPNLSLTSGSKASG